MTKHYGASPADWAHFSDTLGLTEDLLPVVSNPNLKISANSTMKGLGKTPSLITPGGVVGIANWTQKRPGAGDINQWKRNGDYGICTQTRVVRAIDVDIDDPVLARAVLDVIEGLVGELPMRYRDNAAKFLLAFKLPGEMGKRVIRCRSGIIEFLATGQQFIAVGTHTSGTTYEWSGGLPEVIPDLDLDTFERVWAALTLAFAVAPAEDSKPSERAAVLSGVLSEDPVARAFQEHGLVRSTGRNGQLNVTCPWAAEHSTTDGAVSETTYFPPHTGGYVQGNFKCLHAHCSHRTMADVRGILDIDGDVADEFDDLTLGLPSSPITSAYDNVVQMLPSTNAHEAPPSRFRVKTMAEFLNHPPMTWLLRGVIPKAELIVLFGPSTCGKSFMALDIAFAIARGMDWRGRKTKKGRVVYICAEGAGGARMRFMAYCRYNGLDPDMTDIGLIDVAPNFLEKGDALEVAKQILLSGKCDLIIGDTFAQMMPGGNENSGEDVGRALANCKGLHRACGCPVMLVHHSGKDAGKGARGWSGLRAAADAELEVLREEDDRVMTVTKMKDGEDGLEFDFKLRTVELGADDDGGTVTSCVVDHE